jgi:hypothetical protein
MGMDANAYLLFGFKIEDEAFTEKLYELDNAGEEHPPEIKIVYNHDESDFYLTVGKMWHACDYTPLKFELVMPTALELVAARHFCLQHNIPWEEPSWHLIPTYW